MRNGLNPALKPWPTTLSRVSSMHRSGANAAAKTHTAVLSPSIMPTIRCSRSMAAATMLLLAACSGKKDGPVTIPPLPAASITVSTAAPTLSVTQSASGTAALTLGRTNFGGDVALTAEGLPTGVTATFTPASLTAGATSSSLALEASSTAALGAATVTVRARGAGVTDVTTEIALTVAAPLVNPSVTLTTTPGTAAIIAGQSASSVIGIARAGGFAGGVTMTVTGAPTGMTTTLSVANPVTASTLTFGVATLTSVVPGPYTLTLRANATGITEAMTTYVVTVSAPPTNNIVWRFCNTDRFPIWFAYQDGLTGTWQRVTETSAGQYNFAVGQPQVGVATVTSNLGKITTRVGYYGLGEMAAAAASECTENPVAGTKSLSGSVTGFVTSTEVATVSLGTALSGATSQATSAFTINRVPNGPLDLVAVRADLVTSIASRVLLTRNVNAADGSSLGVLDLAGGASFAPANGSVTVTAPNDGPIRAVNQWKSATGSGASFSLPQLSSGVAAPYQGIPDFALFPGDLQQVQATQQVGTTLNRFVTRYTRGPTTIVNFSMRSDPGAPTITGITGGSYPRAAASGALPIAFNGIAQVAFEQSGRSRRWELFATVLGRVTAIDYAFTMPDFGAVSGWLSTWALGSGAAEVTSTFFGQTGTGTNNTPITGSEFFSFGRLGSFSLP